MRRHTTQRSRIQGTIEIAFEIALFVLLSCLAAGWWPQRLTGWRAAMSASTAQADGSPFEISGSLASPDQLAEGQRLHRIYGHSLVPGGIHSLNELASLRGNDRLLAEYYKSFDLSKGHFIVLNHDVVAYVSYRLGDGMYWEKHPTVIEKGELVITDGANFIRARCGNLISYVPEFPTSPGEPTDMDLVKYPSAGDPPPVAGTNRPLPSFPVSSPVAPSTPSPGSGPSSVPSGPEPVSVLPCCFVGGGGSLPPSEPQAPPSEFNADEFSTLPLPILGRLPEEAVTLVAGVLLVFALCFFVRK